MIERAGQGSAIGTALLERIHQPYNREGQRTGGFRFGHPRAMALAGALCCVAHAVTGFSNMSLRGLVAGLLGADYSVHQMTYDLRRLRLHGMIERLPRTNTYVVTTEGSERPCSSPRSTTACCGRCSVPPTFQLHHPSSVSPSLSSTTPRQNTSSPPGLGSPRESLPPGPVRPLRSSRRSCRDGLRRRRGASSARSF